MKIFFLVVICITFSSLQNIDLLTGIWRHEEHGGVATLEFKANKKFEYIFNMDDGEIYAIEGEYVSNGYELFYKINDSVTQMNYIEKMTADSLVIRYKQDTIYYSRVLK